MRFPQETPTRPQHPEEVDYWYYLRRQAEAQHEFVLARKMARLVGRAYARGLDLSKKENRELLCWVGWDLDDYYSFRNEGDVSSPLLP
jgi:hypothetical protein